MVLVKRKIKRKIQFSFQRIIITAYIPFVPHRAYPWTEFFSKWEHRNKFLILLCAYFIGCDAKMKTLIY